MSKEEVLIFSVKLESGNFESTLRLPLREDKAAMQNIVAQWLTLIETGLKTGATLMMVTLEERKDE
jgi:hypothetical protein